MPGNGLSISGGSNYLAVSTVTGLQPDSSQGYVRFLNHDGTAAAPSYAFASDPNTGIFSLAADYLAFSCGGYASVAVVQTGLILDGSSYLAWANTTVDTGLGLFLFKDTANALAQRNSTNPQTFSLYNTYTDASNYERLKTYWTGGVCYLFTDFAGTGVSRQLSIGTLGGSGLYLFTNNTNRWFIDGSTGNLGASADYSIRVGAGVAAAPSLTFAGDPNTGFYNYGSDYVAASAGGTACWVLGATGMQVTSTMAIAWSQGAIGAADGVLLYMDTAGALAQRNSTNAQTFRVYKTYTDASNYERIGFYISGGRWVIGTQYAGTGGATGLDLIADSGGNFRLFVGATQILYSDGASLDVARHLLFSTDNTYDIGASGATRARNLFLGSGINFGTSIAGSGATVTVSTPILDLTQTWNAGAVAFTGIKAVFTNTASAATSLLLDLQYGAAAAEASVFSVGRTGTVEAGSFFTAIAGAVLTRSGSGAGTLMSSTADGVSLLTNFGGTGFTRLQFGGTTASFPCIKRSTTTLEVKLADDSAYAVMYADGFYAQTYLFATTWIGCDGANGWRLDKPSTGVAALRLYDDSAPAALLADIVVVEDADGATLSVDDSGKAYDNTGAAAEANFALPPAVAGRHFYFYCSDASGIKVTAQAGDTIAIGSSVSAAAGNVASTTIGSALHLICFNNTEWVAVGATGTWVVT